jgi:hypothetical protein
MVLACRIRDEAPGGGVTAQKFQVGKRMFVNKERLSVGNSRIVSCEGNAAS